ncbi:hypothetical protein OO006_08050 [Prosthecochloris sp. SCSIO W1101]|uniref:hypothetical protein n=1 Tax=Prosthecochloris sp. SCSIO W1101 TaxID=2992242 RepID=UPI00223E734B|nr:hypothetical protein [Prosthecochloris sp. SCSIO W1101]UZJ40323.1 hypothetical protein OO006_08050 [Prosthecochloris sp. SCSIO W1101]
MRLEKLNRINRELLRVESAFGIELPRVNVVYVTDTNRGSTMTEGMRSFFLPRNSNTRFATNSATLSTTGLTLPVRNGEIWLTG